MSGATPCLPPQPCFWDSGAQLAPPLRPLALHWGPTPPGPGRPFSGCACALLLSLSARVSLPAKPASGRLRLYFLCCPGPGSPTPQQQVFKPHVGPSPPAPLLRFQGTLGWRGWRTSLTVFPGSGSSSWTTVPVTIPSHPCPQNRDLGIALSSSHSPSSISQVLQGYDYLEDLFSGSDTVCGWGNL